MTPRRSFQRKIMYLVAIALLLYPLYWLGSPATIGTGGGKGSPGGALARSRAQNGLSEAQLGEIDPTGATIKLATLGMRGVAANILWEKANRYKMKKDWTNLSATLKQITKLQPHFIAVWRHQAWNLSYNVSSEFDDYRERYRWVISGIQFLIDGTEKNKREPRLWWDVGWFIAQKIGRADESVQFRRLFKKDDDFHASLLPELRDRTRDNWLVGRNCFLKAENLIDTLGVSMKGNSPLIYRSDAPMCQMNYADALEEDGTFGEVAQEAWRKAAKYWYDYGVLEIPTSYGTKIRLGDGEMLAEKMAKATAELDALQPGLRQKILQEKEALLTDQQRAARDAAPTERTEEQHKLMVQINEHLKVTHQEVAARIDGPKRRKAAQLAEQLKADEEEATMVRRYRQIVNYVYWRLRARIEQTDEVLAARKLLFDGNRAYDDGRMLDAEKLYDDGLVVWRKVLDKFGGLTEDRTTVEDLVEVIDRYRLILKQLDKPFPKDFILQDVLDAEKKNP